MALTILSNYSAIRNTGLSIPFGASGGTEPYVYSVAPGGAGGTIDPDTGIYVSPVGTAGLDTIIVTDSGSPTALTASTTIAVGAPIQLICDIIQNQLQIPGQVWLYEQKINIPTDSKTYITVGVRSRKTFANRPAYTGGSASFVASQSVNVVETLSIDLLSRSTLPLSDVDRVIMALSSPYAEAQMQLNSFYVGALPLSQVNVSGIDGPAIPYHLSLSCNLQYFSTLTSIPDYFSSFGTPEVVPDN
jgi:hypothetical protein